MRCACQQKDKAIVSLKIDAQMAIEAEKEASDKLLELTQDLEQTNLGKRPCAGRPKLSVESLRAEHIENLRKQRRADLAESKKVEKLSRANEDERNIQSKAQLLFQMIVEHGRLFDEHHDQLSVTAGIIFEDLKTTGQVSIRKIPFLLESCLTLYFGANVVGALKSIRSTVLPSDTTIERAIILSSEFVKAAHVESFTLSAGEVDKDSLFSGVCLCIDDGNKAKHKVKAKLGYGMFPNGHVKRVCFNADMATSKKTKNSSASTFTSLLDELGANGISLITNVTSDWYGGGSEGRQLLEAIDAHIADRMPAEAQRTFLSHTSKFDENVTYDFAGPFRRDCVRPCLAHSIQSILKVLLEYFGQKSGLNRPATTAQGLYRLHYYMGEHHQNYRAILLELFVEGDPNRLKEIPPILLKAFPDSAQARWLAEETQAVTLLHMLSIEAPACAVQLLNERYSLAQMTPIYEMFQIINKSPEDTSNRPSAFCLALYHLLPALPGGIHSGAYEGFMQILAFLSCPLHRASIHIISSVYHLHLRCLSFANSKSSMTGTTYMSLRLLENSVFCHGLLESFAQLAHNWKAALPELDKQMSHILKDSPSDLSSIQSSLREQFQLMLTKALSYYRDMDIGIGYSFSLITNPVLAPAVLRGIVQGLCDQHILDINNSPTVQSIILSTDDIPVSPDPQSQPPTTSSSLQPPTTLWTATSATHAYPGMTFQKLFEFVRNSYATVSRQKAIAHARRFGLLHNSVLKEVQYIAEGRWVRRLENIGWKIGDPVHSFFASQFADTCPLLAETLTMNFGCSSLTTTAVECSFSVMNSTADPSNCWKTVINDNRHFINVRGSAVEEMTNVVHHRDGTTSKLYNITDTADGRSSYLKKLHSQAAEYSVYSEHLVRPTTRELSKTHGKNADLSAQLGPINEELASNRESKKAPVNVKQLERISNKMTYAKQSRNEALVSSPAEDTIASMLKRDRISILYHYRYKNFTERQLKATDKDLLGEYLLDLVETIDAHAVEKNTAGQFICMMGEG